MRALLLAVALVALAGEARAQCSDANHVLWPEVDPIWEFCWQRPAETTFLANGGGLRVYDVKYKGVTVLRDGTIPVLNVRYDSGCGGPGRCFRDWFYQEFPFNCLPLIEPVEAQICDGTVRPVETSCDMPGRVFGFFNGVAVVDQGDRLKLTAQAAAGWYRYISTWEFFPDGSFRPGMDLTSINHPCIAHSHDHHAYFRLDFDVNGPENDYVTLVETDQLQVVERSYQDMGFVGRSTWRIEDPESPVSVEVSRNLEDGIHDAFSVADGWLLSYDPDELDDGPHSSSQCQADLDDYLNGEPVAGEDIVLWVHARTFHPGEPGGLAQDCTTFGPTIRVFEGADFVPPACLDGIDNDRDGRIDYIQDPGCTDASDESERPDCSDGLDNDGDGRRDWPRDRFCEGPQWPSESSQCSDGIDNDQDGQTDTRDLGCAGNPDFPIESPQCIDGEDNDGDDLVDANNDPGCEDFWSFNEAPQCDDRKDNDRDGKIDLLDPDCEVASDPAEGCRRRGGRWALLVPGLLWLRRRTGGRRPAAG